MIAQLLFVFLFSALLAAPTPAQRVTWPIAATHWFSGTITAKGGPLAIQMAVSLIDEQGDTARVVGEYRYVHKGLPIRLEGRYDAEQRTFQLDEFVEIGKGETERCTGHFVGTTKPGLLAASGTWSAEAEAATLPFSLQLEAVARTASVHEPLAYQWQEEMVSLLGDHVLAREATERINKEGFERLAGGVVGSRKRVAEWLDASPAMRTRPQPTQFSGGHHYGVHFASERLVSLGGLMHEFTGGAHPNSALTCLNLVLRGDSVHELRLADLSAGKDAPTRLQRLVYDELRKQGASMVPRATEVQTDFVAFETFVLSPAGVLFGFSPYQVGSYAEGCYYVHLSWAQLSGVLISPPELAVRASAK